MTSSTFWWTLYLLVAFCFPSPAINSLIIVVSFLHLYIPSQRFIEISVLWWCGILWWSNLRFWLPINTTTVKRTFQSVHLSSTSWSMNVVRQTNDNVFPLASQSVLFLCFQCAKSLVFDGIRHYKSLHITYSRTFLEHALCAGFSVSMTSFDVPLVVSICLLDCVHLL